MSAIQSSALSLRAARSLGADRPDRSRHPSILLIEDDVELVTVFTRMMFSAGYFVTSSQLAEHALAILTLARPVDLIIADLVLPGMGGQEFCTQAAKLRPSTPFIVMTGSDTLIDLKLFPENTDAIYKPFRRKDVMDLIEYKVRRPALPAEA